MIHYINIEKKRLVGRNNQPNNIPLAIDFHTLGTIDFAFINDCNQIKPIDENLKFYLAGSKKMNREESKLLFLSKTYTIKDNVITFTVDTYTQPFIEEITKKNTEINVEISVSADSAQQVLLRDIAYANPRVYVPGFTPPPVDPTEYYTKAEVDNLLGDYQPVSGMNIYALKSEIPSGGSSGNNYTFPLEQRTYACASESISEDGTIAMQNVNASYNLTTGIDRYINNVIVIPSGAPSGKVDFVYEEVSGFVYNPFTTLKFQLDCIPTKEYPTLQEIQFLIEKAGEETIIATTEGLSGNDILRYNAQNDNALFCSQVIALKNILNKELVSVINDKVKLRFIFAYQYFGTSNQKNAPSDKKQTFTVGRNSVYDGYYSFFLSINKDFENPDLLDRLKYYANPYGVGLINNIFDYTQIRYPVDSLQNRNLAFMLNDTGIFGKIQNASYNYYEYHYNLDNYINYAEDYALYDDVLLNNKFTTGGKVRGYTLNISSVTMDANNYGGYFHFIMFDSSIDFNDVAKKFELFPIYFVKHKIYIYNPNGYTLSYQNTSHPETNGNIISAEETGIIEFNFWIDYDSLGITDYSYDYYYVLEKINADGTTKKYSYRKNWS